MEKEINKLLIRIKNWFLPIIIVFTLCLIFAGFYYLTNYTNNKKTLNVLAWIGYEEPEIIGPFEKQYGVKVNVKTYIGGDQMYALLTQSKNKYDAVVVDPEYIEKLYKTGRLMALDPSDYNFDDYLKPVRDLSVIRADNKLYAIPVEFGSNGLIYNTKHLTKEEVSSYKILWDEKVKGKVGIWDWYVPSMGVLSKYLGFKAPFKLNNDEFQKLKNTVLSLKPQVAAIHSTPADLKNALASEATWIVPAAGESFAADLRADGYPVDWIIPKEGGLLWIDALAIPADSQNIDLAKKYIRYMMTPEAQAKLMSKKAFKSIAPNIKAINYLEKNLQDVLHLHNSQEAASLFNNLSVRSLPTNQSEAQWQKVWEEFKSL